MAVTSLQSVCVLVMVFVLRCGFCRDANLGAAPGQTFSISPSFSYQYYTNDHEHLNPLVLGQAGIQAGDTVSSASSLVETRVLRKGGVVTSSPIAFTHTELSQGSAWKQGATFAPPAVQQVAKRRNGGDGTTLQTENRGEKQEALRRRRVSWKRMSQGVANSTTVSTVTTRPLPQQSSQPPSADLSWQPKVSKGKRKILKSRQDEYRPQDADSGQHYDEEHDHYHDHDGSDPHSEETNKVEVESDGKHPEVRDFGLPDHPPPFGGPFFGDPFGGPGPLPPPPPPLKGSVDYILIPLILIGLAGPIFVVLYVILGGFEARLSPITQRSLKDSYSDYKPYIDTITSSVSRALEKFECGDYTVCRLSRLSRSLGISSTASTTIESALSSVTPKEYMPTMRSFMAGLRGRGDEDDCTKYACSSAADTLAKYAYF